MTPSQIAALGWAIETLESAIADETTLASETIYSHIEALCDLFDSARREFYLFDSSKTALIAFMRKHALTIPQCEFDDWRMVPSREQRVGQIQGLDESRGVLRATNGILCYIEQANGRLYGPAHYQHFVPDEVQAVRISHNGKPKVERVSELDKQLAELFATY